MIGGDAAGMSAASQARRRRRKLDIVVFERGSWTSYSACGIPYVVGGDVDARRRPRRARTPSELRDRPPHRRPDRATRSSPSTSTRREVEVRDHDHGRTLQLAFDQLLIGTGGRPIRPDLPGIDLPSCTACRRWTTAGACSSDAGAARCPRVVVVGGGYIGLEMAEAFVHRGCRRHRSSSGGDQVMGTLDPDMGAASPTPCDATGSTCAPGGGRPGSSPARVLTADGPLPRRPGRARPRRRAERDLAEEAGLELGRAAARSGSTAGSRQRRRASGRPATARESFHLVTGEPVHIALGTVANKQGRVAGINIGGGYATFPGVVGTAITKICDTEIARTGLTEREAGRGRLRGRRGPIESHDPGRLLPRAPSRSP